MKRAFSLLGFYHSFGLKTLIPKRNGLRCSALPTVQNIYLKQTLFGQESIMQLGPLYFAS